MNNDDDMKRAFYGRGSEHDLVPAKPKIKPKPNNAPTYMCLYPGLASIARAHGYALAVHGSLARDMDLIAVPWIDSPKSPETVISAIESEFAIKRIGELTKAPHGRMIQTIGISFGECFIDLSFMPVIAHKKQANEQ